MCRLPWPDHSRLRSEIFTKRLKIYRRRQYYKFNIFRHIATHLCHISENQDLCHLFIEFVMKIYESCAEEYTLLDHVKNTPNAIGFQVLQTYF